MRHDTAFIHERAIIGAYTKIYRNCEILDAVIGPYTVIGHNVTVFSGVVIGAGCKIEGNTDLFTGVMIGNRVFIGPNVVFTNDPTPRAEWPKGGRYMATIVRDGASIGANATIVCGVTIGEYAAIAAGSVVTKNVAPYSLFAGNPAHFVRYVCRCNSWGRLIGTPPQLKCSICGAKYNFDTSNIHPE